MGNRPSKIDRMDPAIREKIGQLRSDGHTIDEIMGKLRELGADVSRSGLGRHVQELDKLGELLQRSRATAEALVARFGDAPESRTARLNIELMQGMIMRLQAATGEDGEPVMLDPKEINFIADALHRLGRASKDDADLQQRMRELIKREMAEKLDGEIEAAKAAGEPGLSEEWAARLRRQVLGVPEKPASK